MKNEFAASTKDLLNNFKALTITDNAIFEVREEEFFAYYKKACPKKKSSINKRRDFKIPSIALSPNAF